MKRLQGLFLASLVASFAFARLVTAEFSSQNPRQTADGCRCADASCGWGIGVPGLRGEDGWTETAAIVMADGAARRGLVFPPGIYLISSTLEVRATIA
jgi:hypothetical protein